MTRITFLTKFSMKNRILESSCTTKCKSNYERSLLAPISGTLEKLTLSGPWDENMIEGDDDDVLEEGRATAALTAAAIASSLWVSQ